MKNIVNILQECQVSASGGSISALRGQFTDPGPAPRTSTSQCVPVCVVHVVLGRQLFHNKTLVNQEIELFSGVICTRNRSCCYGYLQVNTPWVPNYG